MMHATFRRAVAQVVVLFAVAGHSAPLIMASGETDRRAVLDFARNKFQHILSSINPADPLADTIPDVFCKNTSRLTLPDICDSPTGAVPVYLVDVLPITGSPIADVVALSRSGDPYSLLDSDGMTRLLRENNTTCGSQLEFLDLVRMYLQLYYTRNVADHVSITVCDADGGYPIAPDTCVFPEVKTSLRGFRADVYAAPRDDGSASAARWSRWHFELRSPDSAFLASLEKEPAE